MPLELPGYSEVRELGAGASGRVVVARYDATGQLVAAKVLSAQMLADPAFRERFRREAEIMGQVRHPNVVSLYGYVDTGNQAVILMELIDGVALEKIVDRGPMDPEAALVVLSGALLGLDAAHRVGIVHRDVKPANMLVETQGGSHLADFGVAVWSGQPDVPAGTPVFMAPEQWQGLPASARTDVYAATGVYYQCVTGRWPFPAESVDQLRQLHLQAWPDVSALPQPIGQLILRGMAKDPAQRPATAGAFHEELERAAVTVHGPDWRRRGMLALGGAAGLFAGLFPLALIGGHGVAAGAAAAGAALPGGSAAAGSSAGAIASGAAAVGTSASTMVVIGGAAAIALAAAAVGGLALTHTGPFSNTAATVSSSAVAAQTPTAAASRSSSSSARSSSQSSSSSSTPISALLGVSHNPLLPAATGNTWTYQTTFGGQASTSTETVTSATPAAGGQNVVLTTTSSGSPPITNTFLFQDNGQITAAQVSGSGFSASTSGVIFTIPTKDDIVALKSFSNTATTTEAGQTVTFSTTSAGAGTEQVTVPAGTFTAYRLTLTISFTIPGAAAPPSAINEVIDLVENVGIVKVTSDFGDEVLVSSNLVHGGSAG
jgi:eukaryotic-like serine/threonine-protein kinase